MPSRIAQGSAEGLWVLYFNPVACALARGSAIVGIAWDLCCLSLELLGAVRE